MEVYDLKGDKDLIWVNCTEPEVTGILSHVVHDGAEIDRNRPVKMEVSDWDAPDDWIATDCPYVSAYGPLLMSERAVSVLGPLLDGAGYLLDTHLASDTRYKLFICECEIDALDLGRSDIRRFRSGNVSDVFRHELRADRLQDQHVFRLKHCRSQVFVSDRVVDLVRRHGLTGFLFQEIWSSETGGVQLQPAVLPVERVRGEFARRAAAKRKALREELARRGGAAPNRGAAGSAT